MIKGIIFDNDGTLADTHDLIMESMRYTLKEALHKTVDDEKIASLIGIPLADQMPYFTNNKEEQEKMVQVYRKYNALHHDDQVRSFEGCAEALKTLKKRDYKLGVATSKLRSLATRGFEIMNIVQYFDAIVGCEDTDKHKPHGDPIKKCADLLKLDISEVAYVGDSPYDIQAAKDAGCLSVAVLWGMFSKENLLKENPDHICANFADLLNIFC